MGVGVMSGGLMEVAVGMGWEEESWGPLSSIT